MLFEAVARLRQYLMLLLQQPFSTFQGKLDA
jgi:hypothetical protein